MWHATGAAAIILTLCYVTVNVIGRLYLSFEYYNEGETLVNGNKCDFLASCDVYFFICIRNSGSTSCDIYNKTTTVYYDVRELGPANMIETEIPLTSPIGKKMEIGIGIWDFDKTKPDDLIAQFDGTIESKSLSMKWSQIQLVRTDIAYQNDVSFKSFVRMECQDGACIEVCIPRIGINTCDNEGNMICEKGLTGPTCNETDHCMENNCADYATCQSLPNGYKCVCGVYEGKFVYVILLNIHKSCKSSQILLVHPELLMNIHFLSGLVCQNGYDPCQPKSPCGPHGQCKASGPNYECVCEIEWSGSHCERPATACESAAKRLSPEAVCLNGGSCADSSDNSSYNCICHQPWSGPRCELIDTCAEENCSSHGVCVFSSTSNESFHCKCNAGWLGDFCRYQSQSPCYRASLKLHTNLSMVCLNGGICIDNRNGVDFACDCKFGWLGEQCETFFTKTTYFILPMVMESVLFLIVIALCIRILRR
ncbi:hypothetical protein Aperf_G00000035830 [Anoplocephala perfoliata]